MRFVLDRSQQARVQKFPRVMAVVVSLTLLVTALEARQPAVAAPAADPKPAAQKLESRPDVISAAVTARSQGSKVEVESMRTETSTTWANPDGTMTTEAHMAPVRFKNASGQWRSVNLELTKGADGTVAPKGHKLGLRLGKRSSASGGAFASAAAGSGRQVEWLAPWKLPEPTLEETKATYADVQPGVDLTLDARRSGFEADFVVKSRPESAPVWRFPLRTKGLTARTAKSGVIEFVDAGNVVRGRIPAAYMWDAAKDPVTGEPATKVVVNVSMEHVSPGKATLVVAPDQAWFMDPKRVFPVTVDPTYVAATASPSFDTFVQTSVDTDLSSTTDLRVGKNGTHQERTFFNFGTGLFQGKDIVSATLSLYQDGSTTCTPTGVNLYGAGVASSSTTWANQPTISSTLSGAASFAKGFSGSCAAGRVGIPMTSLAQYWSTTQAGTVGVALKAASESDASYWKRFRSMESSTDPFVSFTWNRKPNAPATVEPSEAVAYAAPGETSSSLYSASLRPWVRTKATDPDGNTVKYIFEFYTGSGSTLSVKGTCTSSVYASGTTAGCRPATDLPDNTLLYIRAKANDGRLDGPWVSYNQRLRTGAQTPAQPAISCPAPYGNNTWQDTAPTVDVKCTITATGTGYNAPGYLRVIIDGKRPAANPAGGAEGQIKITPSSDPAVAKWDVTFPKDKAGLHTIVVQAESPAGRLSTPNKTHAFGWGGTALTSPTADPRITTADNVRITAAGPPKGTASSMEARVKWRVSGYGGADDLVGWNEDATLLPVTDNGAGGVTVNTLWDTSNAKTDIHLDANPDTPEIEPTELNPRVPVKLDVQVCFKYGGTEQCTWSQTPDTTIQRLPHAFGNGYPTSEAGPGEVALWTGEFNVSASDISVPGYTGDLSISRSHMTYESPGNAITGVFGEGWSAQFDGADAGAAGMQVIDSTRLDGTLVLVDDDGSTLVYESPTGKRRTDETLTAGAWVPVDEDTATDGSKLTVTSSGAATVLSYTEDDGTVTTWKVATVPATGQDIQFRADGISEPGIASKTTFSYDNAGRPTRILAPAPPGVTCGAYVAGTPLAGMTAGCRALHFDYTLIGLSKWRMAAAWLDIYNPDKTGTDKMDSIKVASYSYDSNGRLIKVTDPRSNLSTEYTYNTAGDIATVKPAGQIPFQLNYVQVGDRPKLDTVTRDRPAGDPTGGTATLGKYVYDLPLSGDGLPDLTSGSVGRWNQKSAPTRGFAVFGPDHPVAGSPGPGDWQYADLQYTDAAGYTVNTAKYGAGDWQYTSTDYDDQGNTIRELDERSLRALIDGNLPAGAIADQLATVTVYNSDVKNVNSHVVLTPAGTLVTDTYGPARYASLKDGTLAWVRPHLRVTTDQGAPNGGLNPETSLPYRLTTSETAYAHDPGTGTDVELVSRTLNDYSAPVAGDMDGWARSLPGRTVTDLDLNGAVSAGDIVRMTRYDTEGRMTESRQPASNGADAGTTKVVYFGATANAAFPGCGNKPEWAGLVCRTYSAAQPVSSAGTTPALPLTTTSAFNYLLDPKTITEESSGVTRSTITTYLADGRTESTTTTVTGLSSSVPVSKKTTTYDAATGAAAVTTATNADGSTAGTITTGLDTWGRQVSYQVSGDAATTTTYNAAGEIATVADPNATTVYSYDGTDANGQQERRGLVTSISVTTAASAWTSAGAYDVDGSLNRQELPGGITQHQEFDTSGEAIGLRYTGQVTTTNDDGTTTTTPDGAWLSWSIGSDVAGRTTHEWTPDGAVFTNPASGALPYDRRYHYDSASRLTRVDDRTAAAPGHLDPAALPPCVTRTYSFDTNDNRLSAAAAPAAPDGSCTTSDAAIVTRAFDTADRPVTGANGSGTYSYDPLGRTTTLPASDAPNPTAGGLTLGYYDNDLARSITQAGTTTTFTLDALDRRRTESTAVGGTGGTSVESTRHYIDSSDSPAWVTTGTTTQRYVELLDTNLQLTVIGGAGALTIANPHGDIVTTADLPSSSAVATGITGWDSYDESGTPSVDNTTATGVIDYGWHGADQRATVSTGLVLMGSRLYNPATGLFTSLDPIDGGNTNAYTYPTDPINNDDLDGNICRCGGGRFGGSMTGGRIPGSSTRPGHGGAGRSTTSSTRTYRKPSKPKRKKATKNRRSNGYDGRTVGYTIYYRSNGRWNTWKYGISSQKKYMGRPYSQLRKCQSTMGARCRVGRRIRHFKHRYAALLWEYGSVMGYYMRHGKCPPGQRKSCR